MNLPFIEAFTHGGRFHQRPRLLVVHSTEGPMSRGNARALAGPGFFGGPKAGTSAHAIFDPAEGVEMVKPDHVAFHVGPGGNGFSIGTEHCGRVSLTKEQWLSPDARAMLRRSAEWNAQYARALDIPPRWLSLTALAAGQSGFCTHNDIRLVFGGTTHSDPGRNFPYAWYMDQVQAFHAGKTPPEDDMPLTDADFHRIRLEVITALNDPTHQYLQDELAPIKDGLKAVQENQARLAEAVRHLRPQN
ncbi:MAG TPA: peptidoglycan recognition family protein [Mycobacteriales bacterium]|nr:peptidoglycan recognition family protein [Mycobacteriales bacterium]